MTRLTRYSQAEDLQRRESTTALRRVSSTTAYSPLAQQNTFKFASEPGPLHETEDWAPASPAPAGRARGRQPFRWRVDLARGGLHAAQTSLHYLLMSADTLPLTCV